MDTVPTDKSVGYFHLSLWDKMLVYKKMGMLPNVIEYFSKYAVPTELILFLCVFSTNISFLTERCYAVIN